MKEFQCCLTLNIHSLSLAFLSLHSDVKQKVTILELPLCKTTEKKQASNLEKEVIHMSKITRQDHIFVILNQ